MASPQTPGLGSSLASTPDSSRKRPPTAKMESLADAMVDACAPKYICEGCGDETTIQDSYSHGTRSNKRIEKVCKSIINSISNMKKTKPAVTKAFRDKSPASKKKYVKAKKMQKEKSQTYDFGDLVVEETNETATGNELRHRVFWKPYSIFYKEKLKEATARGDLDVSDPGQMELFNTEIGVEWEDALRGAELKKEFGNVMHIGEYMGVIEDALEREMLSTSVKRSASSDNADDIGRAIANAQETHKRIRLEQGENIKKHNYMDHHVDIAAVHNLEQNSMQARSLNTVSTSWVREVVRKAQEELQLEQELMADLEKRNEAAKQPKDKPLWSIKLEVQNRMSKIISKLSQAGDEIEAKKGLLEIDLEAIESMADFSGKDELLEESKERFKTMVADFVTYKAEVATYKEYIEEFTKDMGTKTKAESALAALTNKECEKLQPCIDGHKALQTSYKNLKKNLDEAMKAHEKLTTASDIPKGGKASETDTYLAPRLSKHLEEPSNIPEVTPVESDPNQFIEKQCAVSVRSSNTEAFAKQVLGATWFSGENGLQVQITRSMKQTKSLFAAGSVADKVGHAMVAKGISQGLGLSISLKDRAEKCATLDEIYEPCIYIHAEKQHILSFTHYAFPEARLLLGGREILIGFKYSEIHGGNFAQKFTFLNGLDIANAIALAKKTGFVLNMAEAGQLILIPAGYYVGTFTITHAEVLRWCFSCPKTTPEAARSELEVVRHCVTDLVDAFPSLSHKFHGKVKLALNTV